MSFIMHLFNCQSFFFCTSMAPSVDQLLSAACHAQFVHFTSMLQSEHATVTTCNIFLAHTRTDPLASHIMERRQT